MDLDPIVFLAFVEGVIREDEKNARALDRHYAAARPAPRRTRSDRRSEIRRFARLAGAAV